jgi:hypothetical protein
VTGMAIGRLPERLRFCGEDENRWYCHDLNPIPSLFFRSLCRFSRPSNNVRSFIPESPPPGGWGFGENVRTGSHPASCTMGKR